MHANIAASGIELGPDVLDAIDEALGDVPVTGTTPDPEAAAGSCTAGDTGSVGCGRGSAAQRPGGRLELHVRRSSRRVADGYRYDWKLLLGAGLLVFVPIGLITALDPLDGNAIDDWNGDWSAVLIVILFTQAALPLLGAVFYSGVVAAGEQERRHGERATASATSPGPLPYWTLILADLALIVRDRRRLPRS